VLVDNNAVNETMLKQLGARGVVRSAGGFQVVLGPMADQVAGDIRTAVTRDAAAFLAALGGRDNVADVETAAGRLLIRMQRPDAVDENALMRLGVRAVARSTANGIQVIVAGAVDDWALPLRRLL
jgi:PTS system N-acetylglucosamine-specific IIC component